MMTSGYKPLALSPLQRKLYKLIYATGTFDAAYYLRNNPDVVASHLNPLEHYLVAGEAEGRAPSPFFDPRWYKQQLPRLAEGQSLLAHYLTIGDGDDFQPMVGMDPSHVRSQMSGSKVPALVAFLRARAQGISLNPNRFFDYDAYHAANPDVARADIDAYYHFVHVGADEGRLPSDGFSWHDLKERYHLSGTNSEVFRGVMLRWRHLNLEMAVSLTPAVQAIQDDIRTNHRPSDFYEAHAAPPVGADRRACDVYAFYLTQFHRVAENDAWWGEGFTEWHNVVRGVPRFEGHYQPRIPSALGFYDLDDPRVMPRQVALAKQAGIAGFAFYYYHFGEQRLLEKPLERFLADPALDVGFFLIWANETWSRRWDGSESEILLEQTYPNEMPDTLAADLVRHFRDPRYRRIDGRPLFAIYRVGAIPETRAWLTALRAAFLRLGENPLIYMAQTFDDLDPQVHGCDGALEFPPHKISRYLKLATPARGFGDNPQLKVWDYDAFADASLAIPTPPYPLIRSCFPSWDNDSRRQGAASVIHGSTPVKFRRWLGTLVDMAEARGDGTNIVCINAWNEWGEGAYLEPDRRFGYAYLNTVQSVLRAEAIDGARRVLLVGHDAFPAGSQRLLLNLGRTLKQDFGIDILFLLLRAGPGYDGLLPDYRGVAETIVARDLGGEIRGIFARGFKHAIVNSSATSAALAPLAATGFDLIQLIHELPGMFAALGAAPDVAAHARNVRRFVASSRTIADMVIAAGAESHRVAVLPQGQYRRVAHLNPVDARERLGVRAGAIVVAGLGYGDLRKGVDLFIATAEAALDAGAAIEFIWQGDWDQQARADLADRIEPLVAAGLFRHLPDSPDIETLLGAADVFFLSSREDPLPSAAIEAWSCGLPVAAIAGAGGIADMIASQPDLGTIAPSTLGPALLDTVLRAQALGRADSRAAWAEHRFDWPRYVRSLVRELFDPPVVDVAIVGHNHGRFAEARIGSIARQTLTPRRITYFDVASNDSSQAQVSEVARRLGVSWRELPGNDGQLFRTWAEIAGASDCEYLHIAEGDDWIAPTMLERCVEALERAPGAAYAFTAVEWVDADDQILASHRDYPATVIGLDHADGGEIASAKLLASDFVVKNPVLTVSSVVWRRDVLAELIRENLPDLEQLGFAFDWMLYLRAARAGYSAVFLADILCRHRQHHESFASRDDVGRHAAEIGKIYALEPAPERDAARQAYLASLVAG